MSRLAEVEGVGTLEFPDGTPDEVIDRVVKQEVQKLRNDNEYAANQQDVMDRSNPFLVAMGRGFHDIGQGIKQLLLSGQDKSNYNRKVQGELESYEKLADQNPVQAFTGRLIGNSAALPIPGGAGANVLTRLGTAAGSGAAQAGLQFTPEDQSRLQNMATGAAFGGATQGIVGEPLRAMSRGLTSTPAVAAERRAVVGAGKKQNVPVYMGDVSQSPTLRELDVLAEKGGPLGTVQGRLEQAEAAKRAFQDLIARRRGNHALGDISDEVRQSLGTRLDRFQSIKRLKYAKAAKIADNAGDIPTPRFDQTIDQAIREIQSQGIASPELVARLEKAKSAPRGPYSVLSALEDDLGSEVSAFYGGANAAVPRKGVQYFQRAKESLRADIESHLQTNAPGSIPIIRDADKFYQENILAFKKTQLSQLVGDKAEFHPETAWRFVERNADSPTMMKTLYGSLTPKGRDAVKAGLLREAFDRGNVIPQGGSPVFSPGRTAKYLEDRLALINTFMKPDDAAEVRGVITLFRHIQRAGQVSENPPTGARLVLPAIIAGSLWEPQSAAIVGGSLLTAKGLLGTEVGRKMLTTLAELPVDNPRTARLASQIAGLLRTKAPLALVQPKIQDEE